MIATQATYVRWGIAKDFPAVLAIEEASFETPWTGADFPACLWKRNCICMVAECGDRVAGYMVYELRPEWIGVLNFAVAPDARRRGVGRLLAEKLRHKLESHRRLYLEAAVRETNLPAQLFWRACGWRACACLPGHFDTGEDAVLMRRYSEVCP